jgi:uncharacterized glyoxalase superfamily protein PhnB
MTEPIPGGLPGVIPHLTVAGCAAAIEFYKKAFGAEECSRALTPDGRAIMHASIKIGESVIFLNDEMMSKGPKALGGTPVALHLYVGDADRWFQRAVDAGAQVVMPLADMFWGDRYGQLEDPFGHRWSIATHKEDVSDVEMRERAKAAFGG